MNKKRIFTILTIVFLFALVMVGVVSANDGVMFRKNVSHTPDQETERANLMQMTFYVPAQSSDGTVLTEGIEYYGPDTNGDNNPELLDTRLYAKPLISVYIDGLLEEHEEETVGILSGAGFGAHDAYAALSLDDGATWKRTNLSNSAELSSFVLKDGHEYPGDAHNMTFAIAGDKVLVGWISKYCDGGSPMYTMPDEDVVALQDYTELPDLYFRDIWGVAGDQKSVDFTLQGFPEVGEIPYSCVWAARGQLLPVELDDAGTMGYDIVWAKAERLTSGRRDANRLEMNGDVDSGFMMTWQEDPEGLRPGQGLGPGEGWSGAVVNQQTDLWYSFISMENFVLVNDVITNEDGSATDGIVPLSEYGSAELPKVAIPMAMPIRLTDNKKCMLLKGEAGTENEQFPYCFVNFDDENPYGLTDLDDLADVPDGESLNWDDPGSVKAAFLPSTDSTFCNDNVIWTTPPDKDGNTQDLTLCKAEDGRILGGRVGASRPRVNVQPYNSAYVVSAEDDNTYDGGIVIMGAEESKALGEGSSLTEEPEDIGKNMWYYTFDLLNPSFVMQGGMLNQPAKCSPYDQEVLGKDCNLYDFMMIEDPLYSVDGVENEFYATEIARRFSHFSQPIHQFGDSGISAVLIVKQGIINQGGPADIFLRMTKVGDDAVWVDCDNDPETPEQCLEEGYNPYAYKNLVCEDDPLDDNDGWVFTDGSNPRYVEGLCLSDMINVSAVTPRDCSSTDGLVACDFPWENYNEDLTNTVYPKVDVWSQCGPDDGGGYTYCDVDDNNLDDQSWENPFDVAKGHRGFIDGDFILMMYAWSPNWKANSVGNDHYNLYTRRSFDGGQTWTTTPADWEPAGWDTDSDFTWDTDGSIICENYKDGTRVCEQIDAGEFEPARNLSQIIGNRETILDPRYSPTGGIKMLGLDTTITGIDPGYYGDERDPSKFFIVYETGDNTTVAEGEAVPLDLFYSRATNWGDDYDLFTKEEAPDETPKDSVPCVDVETEEVIDKETVTCAFDWLEHDRDDLSGEAANLANPAGTLYYAIWNQWQEDEYENVSESDAIFRRILYIDTEDMTAFSQISYVSDYFLDISEFDKVRFRGWARDYDHLGEGAQIINYMWFDEKGAIRCSQDVDHEDEFTESCSLNKEGVCKCTDEIGVVWDPDMDLWKVTSGPDFICDNDQTLIYECTNEAEVLAESLGSGRHTMNFRAMDNEGNWSRADSVDIFVFDDLNQIFLPAVP